MPYVHPELFSEPLSLSVPVVLHARYLSCHLLPYPLKTCTWSQLHQCAPIHILPVPYRKKNINPLLTVPCFYCNSKSWHIWNLSNLKEILKKCFSSSETLFGSPASLITVKPFWYGHSSWEQLGEDCLSLLAWQWISNTQRCPNRTLQVKSALGIFVWPCQGRKNPWQFCSQRTQSVSWILSLPIRHPQDCTKGL